MGFYVVQVPDGEYVEVSRTKKGMAPQIIQVCLTIVVFKPMVFWGTPLFENHHMDKIKPDLICLIDDR